MAELNQNNIVDIIDVEPRHYKTIKEILSSFLPYKKVIAYGSRVKWNASETSDLDLAVFNATNKQIYEAKEAFDESNIPFIVQILNWETIPQDFKENIEHKYHILQKEDDWGIFRLGEVVEVKYGKDHKTLKDGQYPCFGSGGFMRFVDDFLYDDESILITRKGSLNNIIYQGKPFWTVDTMFWTRINKEKANPKFLFYQLVPINYTTLNVGSAVPSLTVPIINEIEIHLPPLPEQKAIAEILSSLDDKIDLLRRQNKTLENLAETLFHHYFIDNGASTSSATDSDSSLSLSKGYCQTGLRHALLRHAQEAPPIQKRLPEPVEGILSKGTAKSNWEVGKLGDFVSVSSGKSLKRSEYVDSGLYPVLGANGEIGRTNKYLYDEKLIYTGRVGTLGNIFINHEKAWLSDNTLIIKTDNEAYFYFVYFLLIDAKLGSYNVGSTQPLIRQSDIKELLIPKITEEQAEKFNEETKPFFNKILSNTKQIQTLEKLRDTLLPKLISGAIRVNYEQ